MAADWTDKQNDAIVADYFAMLSDDVAGWPYSKADHNRSLQTVTGRPRGSIEYKHQNVSAVLKGLGEDWISGYKPAFNFQASLVEAVVRWLERHPDWLTRTGRPRVIATPSTIREEPTLWIGPPPTHGNAPPPDELEQMTAIARKYEVAERDAHNRRLPRLGLRMFRVRDGARAGRDQERRTPSPSSRRSGSARPTSWAIRSAARSPRRSRCRRPSWCAN